MYTCRYLSFSVAVFTSLSEEMMMRERALREYLTPQDVRRIVEVAKEHNERHALFLQTLYETGARISEIVGLRALDSKDKQDHPELGLTPNSIDAENKTIRLICLKRRKREFKYVTVSKELIDWLLDYCQREGIEGNERIFSFTRCAGYQIVRKYAELAGVWVKPDSIRGLKEKVGYVHPHLFRHSHAINIARNSKSVLGGLKIIQERLGHKNLTTTFRYLRFFPREMEEVEVIKAIKGEREE